MKRTNKVICEKSLTTEKMLVKISNVAYGYIHNNKIILTTKVTHSKLNVLQLGVSAVCTKLIIITKL